jgi:ferredoxin
MAARERLVRVVIDPDLCVGSGLCVTTDPERFQIGPEGKARYAATNFDADLAEDAAELCPQSAITLVYEDEP